MPEQLIVNIWASTTTRTSRRSICTAERYDVRQAAQRKNLYTGKTYNSVENISQFFGERGMPFRRPRATAQPVRGAGSAAAAAAVSRGRHPQLAFNTPLRRGQHARPLPKAPPPPKRARGTGTVVEHPKYGSGTVVRREGEGEMLSSRSTFRGYGLKKLVEKYAGLKKT